MLLQIKHHSPVPIYEQLISEIEALMRSGNLKENDGLPSIRQLASQLDVAVNTVARAYQELERKGMIISNGRKGTYVRKTKQVEFAGRGFKDTIIELIKQGMDRREIEQEFIRNLNQIFN
jgi:DNA-binding transcriptional regulator YhcF (GntR family)